MDDTQDKVRRNLVVFSASILIAWFLDLTLQAAAITKLFTTANVVDVNLGRLWVVTFAVLIYLSLRYWFDIDPIKQIAAWQAEWKTHNQSYLTTYLDRKIAQINRTQKTSAVFIGLDSSISNTKQRLLENNTTAEPNTDFQFSFNLGLANPEVFVAKVADKTGRGITLVIKSKLTNGSAIGSVITETRPYDFSVSTEGTIWIWIHSVARVIFYSKSGVDFIIPLILAFLAAIITLRKLVMAYLP